MKKGFLSFLILVLLHILLSCGMDTNNSDDELVVTPKFTESVIEKTDIENLPVETPHTHEFTLVKYDDSYHWHECVCGHKTVKEEHSGGTASETERAKCSICEQSYGKLKSPDEVLYSITFDTKGHGDAPTSINNLAEIPNNLPILTVDEFEFGGWYLDESCSDLAVAGTKLSSNITLYAKWTVIEEPIEINYAYTSHPSSEPNHSLQLPVINHIGDIDEVWNYYRGEGVSVAVIDSGFDISHPEFFNSDGSSRISERSVYIYTDSSGNVYKQVGRNKVGITDGDSHGTMCAGLLGSAVNGKGITGIAPECELILIKIDKKISSMAEAFKYCGDNGIKVVSVSLGAYPSSNGATYGDLIYDAGINLSTYFNESINYAYYKGVTIVSAVGNDKSTKLTYPGGCLNVIGAGGMMAGSDTNIWDEGYEGSNYNGNVKYVDVFAPASGIYAPGFDTTKNQSTYWSGGKGTSFSAPIIAGAAALYFQKYPNKTNSDFELALKNSCVNITSYNGNKDLGYGRLDIGKLLNISEDIKEIEYKPSTTISKEATKIVLNDEAGWNIRTLHIYNLTFASGYGYYDFERFLSYEYGYVLTKDYQLEGTKRCWAYSDQGWSGDYFISSGNSVNAKPTEHEYILPWWVTGATYQFINNSNWLPKEGLTFKLNDGFGKIINNYFWYKSSSDTGVVKVVGETFNYNYPAINVVIGNEIKKSVIYDYFEENNYYYDKALKIIYKRTILTEDIVLYN